MNDLRAEYLKLVRVDLPAAARASAEPWPICLDHCFMRVVLDNLFGRRWYDVLDRRKPAYKQLSAEQLREAVRLARSMLNEGVRRVETLDAVSLRLRGKPPKRVKSP